METIKLSTRLLALASFVPEGASVADIGTDHGYIPVWLAQNARTTKIAAADINKGPLDHAKETAAQYGVTESIRFELCSGLEFEDSGNYDTVIIAGMGGELIASILQAAPKSSLVQRRFILQPNSRIPYLVEWLQENDYTVIDTKLVKDAGKLYQILIVEFGEMEPISRESARLVLHHYMDKKDPLLCEYLDSLLKRYRAMERGMLQGKDDDPALGATREMICDLTAMKEAVQQWQL